MMELTSHEEMTRRVAERWFGALKAGNGAAALDCLDENVVWINNPPDKGLSDIIPWLGEYHGKQAVLGTFVIWAELSQVLSFELVDLVIHGDEALAIVHEVAQVIATGMNYDIEFIQRFRVADEKIVLWKSYWDTVKGILPFRGNMPVRLMNAAQHGDLEEVLRVLPFGADPNTTDPQSGQTVLMMAAARGHLDLVETLLQFGAGPNVLDRRAGTSALHKACQGGHLAVVEALVEAGAFLDQQTAATGHTPLVEAIWFAADDIVAYLLDREARIEVNTYYGFTIDQHIAYALSVNQSEQVQQALQRIQVLVAQRRESDKRRQSEGVLLQSVLAGNLEEVRASLAQGIALESRFPIVGSFSDGHTALLIAARDGHTEIVRELIQAGADVNAIEPIFGAVPLHKATYHGYLEITQLLANAPNVDLNYQGPSNGYTPLHDALWHAFPECAEVLLDAGARTDLVAYDGKLPADIAREKLGGEHAVTKRLQA
jgi:uncharacterized protein